jgi:hypothetical protein
VSRFRISHPHRQDIYITAGVDHMLGLFCELMHENRSKPIKSLDMFTTGKPVTLQAVFEFLIEHEFMTRTDLESALVYLQDGGREPRDMRVTNIILNLKRAAD